MERVDFTVRSTERQIAVKFYGKVIGLRQAQNSKDKILFKGINYNIEISS